MRRQTIVEMTQQPRELRSAKPCAGGTSGPTRESGTIDRSRGDAGRVERVIHQAARATNPLRAA
ncbi:MAG: hypothetical protein KIS97_08865 [Nitrospira sp.]|nr:hypothetical protein [Nitrospira sp.]